MKNISFIVDSIITDIESALEKSKKHIIKTKTIRERTLIHTDVAGINDDSDYLANVGLGQVIQARLYERGYRSVRAGHFVNLEKCEDIDYLQQLLESADTNAADKIKIRNRIKDIRDEKLTGQIKFDISGNVISGVIVPITEEELTEKLEADAI